MDALILRIQVFSKPRYIAFEAVVNVARSGKQMVLPRIDH
jgi:hypothetical protein